MTLSIRSSQRTGWLAILFFTQFISLAGSEPSAESQHVAKYGTMPFNARYLLPSGGVEMSVDWLTLPEERILVLTFDDGPDERDRQMAALLTRHAIPATFFYVASRVAAMPGMVGEMLAGHYTVGYHSNRHQKLSAFSPSRLTEEFQQGQAILAGQGVHPTWFRPPYGDFNDQVVKTAQEHGMETILWTIDSRDWAGVTAPTMARNVIRRFHPGAVLLFHSTRAATLQAMPAIVEAAAKANYRFVSLDEWRSILQRASRRRQKPAEAP
ncbi:MAG: polysaccharide deacetylase family protein [Magnetococcales bacterium]|nr:polysaccharide deacetylase family protein [Magnetococcales bacterium]